MIIVYIHNALAIWGGIERIFVDKMNYLANQVGTDVYLVTTDQGSHPIPYKLDKRIKHVDLNIRLHTPYALPKYKRYFAMYRLQLQLKHRLRKFLDQVSPDVIISTTELFVEAIQSVRKDIPYIVESHSTFSHTKTPPNNNFLWLRNILKKRYHKKIKKASALVCLTEGDAKEWAHIRAANVIPNICNLNTTGRLSELTQKKVIFVGRFAKQKGIKYLIDIWRQIQLTHNDWTLEMYGEGEEKEYWISQLNQEQDHLNITILDPTTNIIDKYLDSSIFVCTSIYEPFGLVITEAMSCGLPVVSFKAPYGPESILDESCGFLIDCFDNTDFAKKLSALMDNEELRRKMGSNAAIRAREFDQPMIMSKWNTLFNTLIEEKR